MIAGARLTAAFSVSLAVHAGALGVLEGMAAGWGSGAMAPERASASALHVALRAEPKSLPVNPKPGPRRSAAPRPSAGEPSSAHGLMPPHVYYAPNELDERPQILGQVEPRFPTSAAVETRRVIMRLYIAELGNVDRISFVDGDPAGPFEAAAAEAFATARFRPGMRGGVAVRSMLTLELLFGEPIPQDPNASRRSDSAPLANPNAIEAPDRAAVRKRPPRHRGGA